MSTTRPNPEVRLQSTQRTIFKVVTDHHFSYDEVTYIDGVELVYVTGWHVEIKSNLADVSVIAYRYVRGERVFHRLHGKLFGETRGAQRALYKAGLLEAWIPQDKWHHYGLNHGPF